MILYDENFNKINLNLLTGSKRNECFILIHRTFIYIYETFLEIAPVRKKNKKDVNVISKNWQNIYFVAQNLCFHFLCDLSSVVYLL